MTLRVLVVGGAGVFGSRLVDAILNTTDWHVVVAGRSLTRASAFTATRDTTRLSAVLLDAQHCTAADLAGPGAPVVVNVAGPFQAADYTLAAAAIEARLTYIDIADGRSFVAGFAAALDPAARARGAVALTGASSTPALSMAVLDELTRGWSAVEDVTVAISPGNRAPRGRSVVRAILSYAGQPVPLLLSGQWTTRPGWELTRRTHLRGLGPRWLSLCDTPDLDIAPARFGVTGNALFLAGLELPALHLGLSAASLAIRAGVVPSLAPFTTIARGAAALLEPFGTDRGGMLVRARGLDASGRPIDAEWSLVAEAGDGPVIPILPVLATLRAMAVGHAPTPGARPCVGLLSLDAIVREMAAYKISTTLKTTGEAGRQHRHEGAIAVCPNCNGAASSAHMRLRLVAAFDRMKRGKGSSKRRSKAPTGGGPIRGDR